MGERVPHLWYEPIYTKRGKVKRFKFLPHHNYVPVIKRGVVVDLQPDLNDHDPDKFPSVGDPAHIKIDRRRMWRTLSAAALVILPIISVAAQNQELVQAGHSYLNQDRPRDGDIIPERTGCEMDYSVSAGGYSARRPYVPEKDKTLQAVKNNMSSASNFSLTIPSTESYSHTEWVFSPFNSYFDATVGDFESSYGANFRVRKNNTDWNFSLSTRAIEQMKNDVFGLMRIHPHPQIRQLLQCKKEQVSAGALRNKNVDINVIANPDKVFKGPKVATLSEDSGASQVAGLGVNGTLFKFNGISLTPEGVMMVAAGTTKPERHLRKLNERFLHELIHILLFHDLSDTIKEVTEQERSVDYIVENMMRYYEKYGNMPMAIYTDQGLVDTKIVREMWEQGEIETTQKWKNIKPVRKR